MPADDPSGFRVAFYGAMSLLAREVRLQLEENLFPVRSMHLYETGDHEGSFTEWCGEAMAVVRPDEDLVEDTDFAFVCGEDDGRTPAELATESGIWIGDIRADPRRPGAFWIWAVCDAVRCGAALNAARMAERLAEIHV